ncbi:MBL fold metallo-hydrolase [Dactylosporangium sp. CA-092794]|uniref:MBL fold metallo-hydrolase n=1 Tax=Dactylosporangium sp. CA-092794 TaxID=3239929 RepID=UPI003D8BA7E4
MTTDLTVTRIAHSCPITYVIQGGDRTVWFGGDTLKIPELDTLPDRFGRFDLALFPTNGLRIRPLGGRQVVMSATEAAELAATLRPTVAVPHHYAFTSGWLGNRQITQGEREPLRFAGAVAALAPDTIVRVVLPGQPVRVP